MLTKAITSLPVCRLRRLPFRLFPRLFSLSRPAWQSRDEANVRPGPRRDDVEEYREKRRITQRLLRANPEYRERERAAQRLQGADPEYRAWRSARRRALRASPEHRERRDAAHRLRRADPESREESNALDARDHGDTEPTCSRDIRDRRSLSQWVVRNEWVRGLTWDTHTPVLYDHAVSHFCSGCGFTPYAARRFWWRRKPESDPSLYDCHDCFTKDWSRVLPRGFEDHVFGISCKTRQLKNRIRK